MDQNKPRADLQFPSQIFFYDQKGAMRIKDFSQINLNLNQDIH